MTNQHRLLQPAELAGLPLKNRMVMAPLTRNRAGKGNVPTDMNVTYYKQRCSAGLIIAEATQISPMGVGYPSTPGIHSEEQIEGWKKVVDAVHEQGGKIFMQLWHVGRISHSSLLPNGVLPVAPSAIKPHEGQAMTYEGMKDYETPRALEIAEIQEIVADYKTAAENAKRAGFDGIEVHAANGYLLDQFLRDGTNQRTDLYGGTLENRFRIVGEVLDAVLQVWPKNRVGIRLSPSGSFNAMSDSQPLATFSHHVAQLNAYDLAYLHLVEVNEADLRHGGVEVPTKEMRAIYNGTIMVCSDYTFERAKLALDEKLADFVVFGRLYIANPDLPQRFEQNAPLNEPDVKSFYGGTDKGYIDYPFLAD